MDWILSLLGKYKEINAIVILTGYAVNFFSKIFFNDFFVKTGIWLILTWLNIIFFFTIRYTNVNKITLYFACIKFYTPVHNFTHQRDIS